MSNGQSPHDGNRERKWWKNPFVISAPIVFVGLIDLVSALRRHDSHEAIAVSLIFFVLVPIAIFVSYLVRRILG